MLIYDIKILDYVFPALWSVYPVMCLQNLYLNKINLQKPFGEFFLSGSLTGTAENYLQDCYHLE